MTCWDRVWQLVKVRNQENERIDREVELLRQSLYADVAMPTDALAQLLGEHITGSVETRIAADGHDVEVHFEDGLWRVIDPLSLTLKALPSSKVAHNTTQYGAAHILTTADNSAHPIFRDIRHEGI